MRKLVTKRVIAGIKPIDGADMIVTAVIDGWEVVTKKDEFAVGDECVFFEIDSFLPANDPRYAFLIKTGVKEVDGIGRIRLRSVRLRKQLSQGLALPVSLFPEVMDNPELDDYSEILNVTKYERPEPKSPGAAGGFPFWLKKTDEDRIQNVFGKISANYADVMFVPTLKLDGTSTTLVYLGSNQSDKWVSEETLRDDDVSTELGNKAECEIDENCVVVGQYHLFSRNLQIRFNKDSHYYKAVSGVMHKLRSMSEYFGETLAIQGETMGEGIQGNPEKFSTYQFFAFNLFSIERGEYLPYEKTIELFDKFGIQSVPQLEDAQYVFQRFNSVSELLKHAEGKSINAPIREGVVWKSVGIEPPVSFKAISNEFLLKVEGNQ